MKLKLDNSSMKILKQHLSGVEKWETILYHGNIERFAFKMAKPIVTRLYLRVQNKYLKYSNKPYFRFTLTEEEKAAYLLFHLTMPMPVSVLSQSFLQYLAGEIGKSV